MIAIGHRAVQATGFRRALQAVRGNRLMFLGITAAVLLLFVVKSLSSSKTYTASATVLFQDPSQDLSLIGDTGVVFRTAQESAQIGASTIIDDRLVAMVKQRVRTAITVHRLKGELSASADPASSQVTISATAPRADLAAALANAAASVAATTQAEAQRHRYQRAAANLALGAARLGSSPNAHNQKLIYGDQIARLRTLSVLAQPVQVIANATPPGAPSSPKPVRDAILGLFLGLLLAFVSVLVRDSLDQRLRSAQEIENALELPVLATVGKDALGKAGLSRRGLGALSEAEFEAIRILRTKLHLRRDHEPPRSILVTSPMPKEGKSTVAASLAYGYAASGQTTLLVECDLRRPTLAERLGVSSEPGLINFLIGQAEPEEIVNAVPDAAAALVTTGTGQAQGHAVSSLAVIVAGSHSEGQPAELLETSDFSQFLHEVSKAYDVVVIDSAPLLPVADTLELIEQVDAIVMCVRATQTTRGQAVAAVESVSVARDNLVGVVVTGVADRDRSYYGYYGHYSYASSNGSGPSHSAFSGSENDAPTRPRIRLPTRRR